MDLRIKDKDFQFRQTDELNLDIEALELPISEHIEEMRQRSLQVLCFAFLAIGLRSIFGMTKLLIKRYYNQKG